MNTKLQELTDKIYQEGVEKGNAEAEKIINNAQSQADSIITEAQSQAEKIIADAHNKSAELNKNTQSELRLFAQQSVNALRTEITDLISGKIVSDSVKAAASDKNFMQKVILILVQEWAKNDKFIIEAKDTDALTSYFMSNAKNLLNHGVEIRQVNGKNTNFAIVSKDKGYKVTFGEDELIKYFKGFLRPKLIEMLF